MKFYALKLAVINVIIFFLEIAFPFIITAFALRPALISTAPWMMITSIFLHANFEHLFYNMFALVLFGLILEKVIGSRRFLFLFFISGFIANIAGIIAYPDALSLGASGAVMGVIGALAVLRPKLIVWFGAPMPMVLLAAIWIIIDAVGIFTPADSVGHAAHLGGFAVGILAGLVWRKKFSVHKEVKRKVKDEFLSDRILDSWEDKYM